MSCIRICPEFFSNLNTALFAVAKAGHKLFDTDRLNTALLSVDAAPTYYASSTITGIENLIRLLHVANHRACNLRYPEQKERFQSIKNRTGRTMPDGFFPVVDYALLVSTAKAVDFIIYQCQEDGKKVKVEDRKYFAHFEEVRNALYHMVRTNNPEYQLAGWGEVDFIQWDKRY